MSNTTAINLTEPEISLKWLIFESLTIVPGYAPQDSLKFLGDDQLYRQYLKASGASVFAQSILESNRHIYHLRDLTAPDDGAGNPLDTRSLQEEFLFLLRLVRLWPEKILTAIDHTELFQRSELAYFGRPRDFKRAGEIVVGRSTALGLFKRFHGAAGLFIGPAPEWRIESSNDVPASEEDAGSEGGLSNYQTHDSSSHATSQASQASLETQGRPSVSSDNPLAEAGNRRAPYENNSDKYPINFKELPGASNNSTRKISAAKDILSSRLSAAESKRKRYAGTREPNSPTKYICEIAADLLLEDVKSSEKDLTRKVRLRLDHLFDEKRFDSIFLGKKGKEYYFSGTTKDITLGGDSLHERINYHMTFIINLALKRLEQQRDPGNSKVPDVPDVQGKPHGNAPTSGNVL